MGYVKKLLDRIYRQFFVRYGLPAKTYLLGFYWDSLLSGDCRNSSKQFKTDLERFKCFLNRSYYESGNN